jgi:TolA-binding protein
VRTLGGKGLRWAAAGLIAATLGVGCAASADVDTLSQNEQTLRGMIANDRQQISALQEQVGQLNDRVTELQHNGVAGGGSKQLASINDRLAKLESQVNAAQAGGAAAASGAAAPFGAAGAAGAGAAAGGEASASLAPGSAPMSPPAGAAPPSPVPAVPGWQSTVDQELANSASSSEPGARVYREGLMDMKAGRYEDAISKFQAFQRAHPKSPLVEPAEYFSANALFELGARDPTNYNQAILQFNDLAMRYPMGRFAASAELREAQAFLRTNDSLDARLTLQKLVRDHPDTAEASAANAMIKSMASD